MRRYIYNYQTVVSFDQPVKRHAVLLRAMPVAGSYMEVEEEHLLISPGFHLRRGTDQLGNRIGYGCQHEAHESFVYVSTGIVNMAEYRVLPDGVPLMVYREQTPLTFLSEEELGGSGILAEIDLPSAGAGEADCLSVARTISHLVNEKMSYVPSVTTTDTPASSVLATLRGVCQDYAHLMIALCRCCGLAARYVCGMMEGEGETHAWVEIWDGSAWTGFDPTHDAEIKYGYLKLAHGRDAADCPVNRGIYMGNARQTTDVRVLLKEI